jgi:hypothetical protein
MLTFSTGWNAVQIAPVMQDFATGMLGVYFFGNNLCMEHIHLKVFQD